MEKHNPTGRQPGRASSKNNALNYTLTLKCMRLSQRMTILVGCG